MKTIALGLLVGFLAAQAFAADGTWMTDLPKAQAKAKAEKKMVLVDFTGSDWCPPCKALHKNVLSSPEFLSYAKDNLVLVEIDFPRTKTQAPELKKANKELAKKHDISGYPTVVVFDSNGKELMKEVGYDGKTKGADFVAKLKDLKKA
ncbi:MAG TPA: thioredoxin family protein [Pyrinomonadaceae bacterium]|jgi:protein disulfide-isomerase|nr:thioredoxin family protein [Pyrinomonadaceae bacterium]